MLAMQYSFTLPAAFDMEVIRHRIATKGPAMDHFPGLAFKAYLFACRDEARRHSLENLYAPFYLWHGSAGMNDFLCGPGFEALTRDFGWPAVETGPVWHSKLAPTLAQARCATREVVAIAPHTALAALRQSEVDAVERSVDGDGALGSVTACEPATWTLVRFRLWRERRDAFDRDNLTVYEVGHLSIPRPGAPG